MHDPYHSTDSYWQSNSIEMAPLPLERDLKTEVCVVGAGIAGLTTAYELLEQGKQVVILDRDGPAAGMSARTTAHLSNALDDRYYQLERWHGAQGSQLAAESHTWAISRVEEIVAREKIECDFRRLEGYLVAAPERPKDELEHEFEAARRAGLPVRWGTPPWPGFSEQKAILFPQQAQFHPLRYLQGLTKAVLERGGQVYGKTKAVEISGRSPARVATERGPTVEAEAVVVCTNTPINNRVFLHTKQSAYTTYVVAWEIAKSSLSQMLFWDTLEAYHYVRIAPGERHNLLIVGGEDHKTGQMPESSRPFRELERWAREHFPRLGESCLRWSGEVFEPVDGLAYIGANAGDTRNVFVCTGDSGNGMTHGTLAGRLISDLLAGRKNPWSKVYDPSRVTLRAGKEFLSENLNVMGQYTSWLSPGEISDKDELQPGEGAVVRQGLRKLACYREPDGTLHELEAVCPHLGGIVAWNSVEKTWDCPCHGSRFDRYGKVFVGPANEDLCPVQSKASSTTFSASK